jgi:hypothetical protein
MSRPVRALLAALLAAALPAGPAAAQASRRPTTPAPAWSVTLTQVDKSGTLVGAPQVFDCTPTGCEQLLKLDVEGKPFGFVAAFTFVPRGAYVAIQSMQPEIRKVIEFDKGFQAPIFVQWGSDQRYSGVLRFTLVGSALAQSEAESPQIMSNATGLVFHRKLVPDLTLQLLLVPAVSPGG